jgi:ubiquinol-cytochrome c reductase cytochrome b subunit
LRLIPPWDKEILGYLIPKPLFPGVLLPRITFMLLFAWPWLEARATKDREPHHLLDRPRDRPVRTALGAATIAFYVVLFAAGATDVIAVAFQVSVNRVVWTGRVLVLVLPVVVGFFTHRLCKELQRRDPLPPSEDGDEVVSDPEGDTARSASPTPPREPVRAGR